LASIPLYRRVIDALEAGADAVIPVVPVADTLRSLHGDPVDRDSVRAVQTPQGFRAGVLREAHAGGGDATDDAALVELLGYQVSLVDGERSNLKLTERVDLLVAAAMIDSPAPGDSARGDTAPGDSAPDDTDRKGAAENFASGSRFEPDDTDSDSQ
ncbi:MAG TPA: 2-C-methyl-D-erythritol 4-phosphate cytidylyltransferase, partial [Microthrixaceae bacterium]|nr:2-C-methyl-D-erythritol 4-phosphate cytidylyltransferase [Microthrixaceae bacterium]